MRHHRVRVLCVDLGGMNLGAAYWVGAVKRDAEGSYMQLQVRR